MKKSLLALALATLTASCANATPYAPQQYDFSELVSLPAVGYGIVESVHEAQLDGPYKGVFAAFEHAIKPETIDRLVVRLDDGRAVTLLHEETDRLSPASVCASSSPPTPRTSSANSGCFGCNCARPFWK